MKEREIRRGNGGRGGATTCVSTVIVEVPFIRLGFVVCCNAQSCVATHKKVILTEAITYSKGARTFTPSMRRGPRSLGSASASSCYWRSRDDLRPCRARRDRPRRLSQRLSLRSWPTAAVDGYFARHRVKPGITGWAQINGWRGEIDTETKIQKRVEFDLHYIENWSVLFDLYILCRTPLALLETENAY